MIERTARPDAEGIERRRFLKAAATVAWGTPLILTMTARQASAQGGSCLPNGGPCDACVGMPCCDEDGPEDGGCCCTDFNQPADCSGVCVAVDADCPNLNTSPDTDFLCAAAPSTASVSARSVRSKRPK